MGLRWGLVALDLDGTLVDSAPDLANAANLMLEALGRPPRAPAEIRSWIGNGVPMLVRRTLTGEMHPDREPEGFSRALELFNEAYAAHLCDCGRLYPGVLEGLSGLRALGVPTCVLTNKHSRFTRPLLDLLGVTTLLDYIGCGDDFSQPKPHPESLLATAHRFGVPPRNALMVGDSSNDILAARAAGFGIVLVPYGYHGATRPEDLGADHILHSLAELPGFLQQAA